MKPTASRCAAVQLCSKAPMAEPARDDETDSDDLGSGGWGGNSCCAGMIAYPIVGALLLWLIFPEEPNVMLLFPFFPPLGWAVCSLGTWLIKQKQKQKSE